MSNNPLPEFPTLPAQQPEAQPTFSQPTTYSQPNYQQPAYAQPQYGAPAPVDSGSFGWAVLGFFIPIVGLILFLVWKDTKPLSAKKAGIGALVGVILSIVFTILSWGAMIALFAGTSAGYAGI